MKKISTLIKYELINLIRGGLVWVMALLYIFGVQQVISSMNSSSGWYIAIFKLIKVSWLPLNLIAIPLMLMAIKIGKSDTEIFQAMDISTGEVFLSKIGVILIIDFLILFLNMLIYIIVAVISKPSLEYILYQGGGYILNSVVFLLVFSILGLVIGQTISKSGGDILSFLFIIILFIGLSNFYKTFNMIIPVINIETFPTSFNAIKYGKEYIYHNIFWITIILSFLTILYTCNYKKAERKKIRQYRLGVIVFSIIICLFLGIQLYLMKPTFYNIGTRKDVNEQNYKDNKTFFAKEDCGYYISKYNMDISIGDELKSKCTMDIEINKNNIKNLQFGLYDKLHIEKITLNGNDIGFIREGNSVKINLDNKYKSGEKVKLEVCYKGKINTEWLQGKDLFFVRNNSIFLADVFEWYPKLNDSKLKDYNIQINNDSKNKLYSNLEVRKEIGGYNLCGRDSEVFLVSGKLKERNYKGYLFVGNEEVINNDENCNILIKISEKDSVYREEKKKIIVSPFIPGISKMDKGYEKAYLKSLD